MRHTEWLRARLQDSLDQGCGSVSGTVCSARSVCWLHPPAAAPVLPCDPQATHTHSKCRCLIETKLLFQCPVPRVFSPDSPWGRSPEPPEPLFAQKRGAVPCPRGSSLGNSEPSRGRQRDPESYLTLIPRREWPTEPTEARPPGTTGVWGQAWALGPVMGGGDPRERITCLVFATKCGPCSSLWGQSRP